jgi:hypothetical protein
MAARQQRVHVSLSLGEAEHLGNSLVFALSFLQEFALDDNRAEIEAMMAFVGRLEVAVDAADALALQEEGL